MENNLMQQQIDDINRKLDFVIEEIQAQKEMRQSVSDLASDMSIIGKDIFRASVTELDNACVNIDGDAVKTLLLKVLRNIDTLNEMFDMLGSAYDLVKDISPILHQIGLDGINMLNKLETEGYIDFANASMKIVDNVVKHYSTEDVRELSDNIVTIMDTIKSLTQPDMLNSIKNAVVIYKNMSTDNIPEYSLFKAFRAMNSPEMKKGLGFMITFLKNIAAESNKNKMSN